MTFEPYRRFSIPKRTGGGRHFELVAAASFLDEKVIAFR
jgi:hypothetical protein